MLVEVSTATLLRARVLGQRWVRSDGVFELVRIENGRSKGEMEGVLPLAKVRGR